MPRKEYFGLLQKIIIRSLNKVKSTLLINPEITTSYVTIEDAGITNDILQPNNSIIYGKEPDITSPLALNSRYLVLRYVRPAVVFLILLFRGTFYSSRLCSSVDKESQNIFSTLSTH